MRDEMPTQQIKITGSGPELRLTLDGNVVRHLRKFTLRGDGPHETTILTLEIGAPDLEVETDAEVVTKT